MTKEGSHMEVRLIRSTPSAIFLGWESGIRRNGAEEVHTPLSSLCTAVLHVEETKRNMNIGYPLLIRLVERSRGGEFVVHQVGDVEAVKGSTSCADFGRVVDEG